MKNELLNTLIKKFPGSKIHETSQYTSLRVLNGEGYFQNFMEIHFQEKKIQIRIRTNCLSTNDIDRVKLAPPEHGWILNGIIDIHSRNDLESNIDLISKSYYDVKENGKYFKMDNEVSIDDLKIGVVLNNEELSRIFLCSKQGGMRRSKRKNSLVLVSDDTKLYRDRWHGDILHYTGMGQHGDQDINFSQNRTLNQSNENKVRIFLFEVLSAGNYTYRGPVKLESKPYQDRQFDLDGTERNVWIFPIKLINTIKEAIPDIREINSSYEVRERKSFRRSNKEIEEKNEVYKKKPVSIRETTSVTYERDSDIIEYAKRRANGTCELCKKRLDFEDKKGRPFLEIHHIKWLSKGGEDTIDNTVALCPNCHRRMHVKNDLTDIKRLKSIEKFIR